MRNLAGKLAASMPSLSSQVKPPSYNPICLILDSILLTLTSCSANLVSSVIVTMGGVTVVVSGGAVSQWFDRWNGTPCKVPSRRTCAVWDAWGTVSLVLMPTEWWSWQELSIWSKRLLTTAMNSWIKASVEASSSDILSELFKLWCESTMTNRLPTLL